MSCRPLVAGVARACASRGPRQRGRGGSRPARSGWAPSPPAGVRAPPPPLWAEGQERPAEHEGREFAGAVGLKKATDPVGAEASAPSGGLGRRGRGQNKGDGRGGGSCKLTLGEVVGAQEDESTGKTFPFVLEHLNVASGQGLGQRGSLSVRPGQPSSQPSSGHLAFPPPLTVFTQPPGRGRILFSESPSPFPGPGCLL